MTAKSISVLVAAGIGLGGAVVLARQAPNRVTATITLAAANGTCGKTMVGNDTGDRIRQRPGGAIQWIVTNNCGANATVAVGGWKPATPGGGGNTGCAARPGGGSCTITDTIRGNATPGTYSYTVSINGAVTDPEIIVEQ
jgi:hypothetical protein